MAGQHIDGDKLRFAIRRVRSEYVFYMLDDAITLLPQTKLCKVIARYLNPVSFIRTVPERKRPVTPTNKRPFCLPSTLSFNELATVAKINSTRRE